MENLRKRSLGVLFCALVAIVAYFLGKTFPIIGGPVFAILLGMLLNLLIRDKSAVAAGVQFTSKKVLQYAVILLGFGLNLNVVFQTGLQSLPIILTTITTALLVACAGFRWLRIPASIATLIGVGSSICGGSAIAATAPVIDAEEEEVAQAISVIFLFNLLAALIFPSLGAWLGFSTHSGEAFGIFAGTAVNDTSSVTATASTWDNLYHLGSQTLDKAVTVKLTRTLAIIPITLFLAVYRSKQSAEQAGARVSIKKVFPYFILYFLLASLLTTVLIALGVEPSIFNPLKECSKFFIIMAMAAIGFHTNIVTLVRKGGKPILLGFLCWIAITLVALTMQHLMELL